MAKKRSKEKMTVQPSWLKLQEFFFRAMAIGYANSGLERKVPGMPGHKRIGFSDQPHSDLVLVDQYCVNKATGFFFGTTTIFDAGVPVWYMHYSGNYEKGAIGLLKEALKDAYSRQLFRGGRGPAGFSGGIKGMAYINMSCHGDFAEFNGTERIVDSDNGQLKGWCDYRGGLTKA